MTTPISMPVLSADHATPTSTTTTTTTTTKTTDVKNDAARKAQYETSDNLDARSWFNQLTKRGVDAFEFVGQLIEKRGLLGQGHVAEVGCGAGMFWTRNQRLLGQCKSILLSDFSQGMLDACKSKEWFKSFADSGVSRDSILEMKGIETLQMDLVKGDARFAGPYDLVLALFMLYELRTPEAIQSALANIAQSMHKETGACVAMTMKSSVHMGELYRLVRAAADELKLDVVLPAEAPAIQAFCAENAEPQLRKHFSRIEKFEIPGEILIKQQQEGTKLTGAQCIVRYLRSLEFVQRLEKSGQFDERFFAKLEEVAKRAIDQSPDGTFVVRRLDVAYLCQK